MPKCFQCQCRIKKGYLCGECFRFNTQPSRWRLKARHHSARRYPTPYGVLTKGDNRLKLAIKAARIRMPWQYTRRWFVFELIPGYWVKSCVMPMYSATTR